jgi:hypothetical protein
MTLSEWTGIVVNELRDLGYDVSIYQGFPLVKRPTDWDAGVRLLKLRLSVAVDKRIYAEGMLIVPAGSPDR